VLERVTVTGYVTPLREGGSLPALVEADNLGTHVLKFRGAGHGALALVAEIIAGQLARRLGLRAPELALAWLDPRIAASEPDQEIHEPRTDVAAVRAALAAFERACSEGPLADRPLGERFRWLTAPRSAVVQPGPVHAGITADPAAELNRLFTTLVRT